MNAGNGRIFVLVGRIAADTDRANRLARGVERQHAARHRNKTAIGRRRDCALKRRAILQAIADGAARNAHAERAPRLADRDVSAQHAGAILPLQQNDGAAGIEHRDGERQQLCFAARLQRAVDDLFGRRERHRDLEAVDVIVGAGHVGILR